MFKYICTGLCMCAGAHVWVCLGRSGSVLCVIHLEASTLLRWDRTWCLTKDGLEGQTDPPRSCCLQLPSVRITSGFLFGPEDQTHVYRVNSNWIVSQAPKIPNEFTDKSSFFLHYLSPIFLRLHNSLCSTLLIKIHIICLELYGVKLGQTFSNIHKINFKMFSLRKADKFGHRELISVSFVFFSYFF